MTADGIAPLRASDRPHVAVIGPGTGASAEELSRAHAVGAGLAAAGAIVVCGGLGGVMEAACRGAREAAPRDAIATVGILPGADRRAANPWVDVAVATGLGELRNGLVVRSADALIAVGGAFGTLSEIALALKAGKTVIGLGTWELARGGQADATILLAGDADVAVRLALDAAQTRDEDA